jgi:hypothetical protein
MLADGPLFREITAAIASGASVDWQAAELGTSDPAHRGLLEQLKVLAAIQAAAREGAGRKRDEDAPIAIDELLDRWGDFELLEVLGSGSYGRVYRAWDARLARHVALKLLPEAQTSSPLDAVDEGRLLARVRHPNVVMVYGADRRDGWLGVWMELVRGRTLEEIVRERGPLDEHEAALVGADVCNALVGVHGAGVVHRDIKAQNVMREDGGRQLLMDFGTGRERAEGRSRGDMAGSPLYMAPELFAGAPATVQSDLYSVGVLLYRLVTRSFPIAATSLDEIKASHERGAAVPIHHRATHVSAEFAEIVDRATARDPQQRFDSAAAMEAALWGVLQRAVTRHVAAVNVPARRARRWRLAIASAVAFTLSAGLLAWRAMPAEAPDRGPASTFFLSGSGWLAAVERGRLSLIGLNPHEAFPLVVLERGRVVRTGGGYRDAGGASFTRTAAGLRFEHGTPSLGGGLCCWFDGASDGVHNYSIRLDVYGNEPPALYQFSTEWTSPQALFTLPGDRPYGGIAHDPDSDAFWVSTRDLEGGLIERWDRQGKRLQSFRGVARMTALGYDPADRTLWVVADTAMADTLTLTQFGRDGKALQSVELAKPEPTLHPAGGEFGGRP